MPEYPFPIYQSDNSVRPEDGPQDVSQDPRVCYDEAGQVVEDDNC
jgi:hypothetical protein